MGCATSTRTARPSAPTTTFLFSASTSATACAPGLTSTTVPRTPGRLPSMPRPVFVPSSLTPALNITSRSRQRKMSVLYTLTLLRRTSRTSFVTKTHGPLGTGRHTVPHPCPHTLYPTKGPSPAPARHTSTPVVVVRSTNYLCVCPH